ncbi:MAG: NAD-dependent epimerase/dehydratase family protein [Planctomycetota bacterium]|nr:MAG: NAD-dependent epimerase/dehydratase family protein [Planctomycetota bacterium]
MSYLLLTGSTGLVGRHLLRDLLAAEVPVAAMVRPGKGPTTLAGIMGHWEQQAGRALPRPVVIEGDLCLDEVVPDADQRRWLSEHCDSILSCAASMTFREDKKGEPFRTNVDGTRHLLELCRSAGIRDYHQVSTAYICGLRQGKILESDIDVGQTLGNVYEKSKLEAEKMIRAADFLDQRTFYRPASVLGDSRSGYVTSFHGFYLPLQLAHAMAGRVPVKEMNERFFAKLGLQGHEGKNLVPVEWLSAAIVHLVTRPEHHGQTYHLASADPVPVAKIQEVIRDAIERYYPRPLATSITEAELASLEGLFYEYMSIYESHWRDDPKFDLTNTRAALPHLPCPSMDYDALLRVSRYPVERNFIAPRHEVPAVDFDVAAHVEGLAGRGPASGETIGLQVNGPGGGQWQLQLAGGEIAAVERGLPSRAAPGFYLSAATFARLAQGESSIVTAINSGRLIVHSDGRRQDEFLGALEQIVSGRTSGRVATHAMN